MSHSTSIPEGYKRCSRGDECINPLGCILPATPEFFPRNSGKRDGLEYECRECRKAYLRRWYVENADRARDYNRRYYHENTEKIRQNVANYQRANRDEINAKRRAADKQRKQDPKFRDHINAATRIRKRRWRAENPDKALASERRYRIENVDKARARKLRRRARKLALPDTFTVIEWYRALTYFGDSCAVCGRPADFWLSIAADHWIPLSKGGATTALNIIPLCHGKSGMPTGEPNCNQSKGAKNPETWLIERFGKRKARQILARIQAYFAWIEQQD